MGEKDKKKNNEDIRQYFTWKKLDKDDIVTGTDQEQSENRYNEIEKTPVAKDDGRRERPRKSRKEPEEERAVEQQKQAEEAIARFRPDWSRAVPPIPADLLQNPNERQGIHGLTKRALYNPLVPLGMAATVGALTMMFVTFFRKDRKRLQFYMRARIAAQGFTFAALVGTVYYLSKQPPETSPEIIS